MMVDIQYDIQVSECRKAAKSIGPQIWTDDEIKTKIILRTSKFHSDIGISAPYEKTTYPNKYNIAKSAIISLVAADLLRAVEDYREDVKMALDDYNAALAELKKTASSAYYGCAGANLTDQLDPDNYIQDPSDA